MVVSRFCSVVQEPQDLHFLFIFGTISVMVPQRGHSLGTLIDWWDGSHKKRKAMSPPILYVNLLYGTLLVIDKRCYCSSLVSPLLRTYEIQLSILVLVFAKRSSF